MLKAVFAGHMLDSLHTWVIFPHTFSSSTVSFLRPNLSLVFQMLLCPKFNWSHYYIDSVISRSFPHIPSMMFITVCLFLCFPTVIHWVDIFMMLIAVTFFLSQSLPDQTPLIHIQASDFFFFLKSLMCTIFTSLHWVAFAISKPFYKIVDKWLLHCFSAISPLTGRIRITALIKLKKIEGWPQLYTCGVFK